MLDDMNIGKHQEELHVLLRKMALSDNMLWSDTDSLPQYLNILRAIYKEDFHHQYSKLFDVVKSIFEDSDKDVSVFHENLKTIRKFISDSGEETLLKIFDKLRDHLSLEISRLENMVDMRKDYKEIEDKARGLQTKIDELSNKLTKIQTDFVAILAIFAAVVVAFSSGSNYILSALSTVSRTFTKEIIFIILLCGLILMDTLFMLIYFIGSIIGRYIGFKWWIAVLANIVVVTVLICVCR